MNFIVSKGEYHPIVITPQKEQDRALFEHCSEGMIAVTPEYFKAKTESVLRAHIDSPGVHHVFQFFNTDGMEVRI